MSTYILIHGAWHGSWCWNKVIPLLENQGHTVIAPDLPSHGNDKTPINKVTFKSYTDCVCDIVDAQSEPVIIVGHSMGGCIISQVAEYHPEKIKRMIYLAAFMLKDGESLLDVFIQDADSILLQNIIPSEDQIFSKVREEAVAEAFYEDCSAEDISNAKSLLGPQPSAPIGTPIKVTNEKFGRIPKVYIECLADKAVSPVLQKKMYSKFTCQKIISINSGHSPFFSAPEELVSNLTSL